MTIDERQEFITTIKNLTQSLSNQESLNRTIQEQAEAYQKQIKNLTDQVLKISDRLRFKIEENTARMEYTKKLRG